jgi:hypothetical protein
VLCGGLEDDSFTFMLCWGFGLLRLRLVLCTYMLLVGCGNGYYMMVCVVREGDERRDETRMNELSLSKLFGSAFW